MIRVDGTSGEDHGALHGVLWTLARDVNFSCCISFLVLQSFVALYAKVSPTESRKPGAFSQRSVTSDFQEAFASFSVFPSLLSYGVFMQNSLNPGFRLIHIGGHSPDMNDQAGKKIKGKRLKA